MTLWEDMVNKGSHFGDFVKYRPFTYTRTKQSLPPLWGAIKKETSAQVEICKILEITFL